MFCFSSLESFFFFGGEGCSQKDFLNCLKSNMLQAYVWIMMGQRICTLKVGLSCKNYTWMCSLMIELNLPEDAAFDIASICWLLWLSSCYHLWISVFIVCTFCVILQENSIASSSFDEEPEQPNLRQHSHVIQISWMLTRTTAILCIGDKMDFSFR